MPDPLTLRPLPPVMVRFKGERAGEAGLTLGQRNILDWMDSAPEPFDATIGGPFEVPDRVRVEDVADSLAVLISKYEGLRTTFAVGDVAWSGAGGVPWAGVPVDAPPRQRVTDQGELALEVYDCGPVGVDPAQRPAVATALGQRWRPDRACGLDQLPLWVAVATSSDGFVRAAAARFSHLVLDFQAAVLLGQELTAMLRDPSSRVPGATPHQPLDQVEKEQSPRMRRRVDRALRHWERRLLRMPQCLYPAPSTDGPAGGSMAVEMSSEAAALALRRVAARTGLSRPSAVLAAACALLARCTGLPELVFATLASNRFEQHLAGYVGTLAQTALASVEVGTANFDELAQRAWLAVLSASRHGMYDVTRSREIERRVTDQRGVHLTFEPMFNSPAIDPPQTERELPSLAQIEAAAAGTTLRNEQRRRTLTLLRFDLSEYDEVMRLSLWTGDTSRVSAAGAEQLLRAVERLLVAAASGDLDHGQAGEALALAVAPVEYGPGWVRTDSCWVELAEVQRLLDEALAPAPARIFAEVAGRPLVAYVAADASLRTPQQAHARCVAALPGRLTAMAPRYYVLCEKAPAEPASGAGPAGWGTVIDQGSGRS